MKNLFYVVYLVTRGNSSYDWTEKFAAVVIEASSEDEAYSKAIAKLPQAIGWHRDGGEDPTIEEGDEKDCVVDVTPLEEVVDNWHQRWEDIRTWEESPPF